MVKISNLKDQFTNTLMEFYEASKPAITSIISLLSKMLQWVQRNKETVIVFMKIAGAIAAIVVAIKIWTTVTTLFTAAQTALNFAMAANPIGLVIVAVAGLIAVMYILISQYKTVQELHSASMQKNMQKCFLNEEKNSS